VFLRAEKTNFQPEIMELKLGLAFLGEYDSLGAQFSDLESRHEILQDEKLALDSQFSLAMLEIEQLEARKLELESLLLSNASMVSELESQLAELKGELAEMQLSFDSLEQNHTALLKAFREGEQLPVVDEGAVDPNLPPRSNQVQRNEQMEAAQPEIEQPLLDPILLMSPIAIVSIAVVVIIIVLGILIVAKRRSEMRWITTDPNDQQ